MNITNNLQSKKITMVEYLNKDIIKNQISNVIGKNEIQRFITSIVSAINTNAELSQCDKKSILSAALLGETLKLSPSPQLGQYYMIPFNVENQKKAQFVLGYKGYLQLAIRTGCYKKINVISIKEGELLGFDPLNEEIKVNLISDFEERESAETIGYYAYIEYMNGFQKSLYWSKNKMENHARKYSTSYIKDINKNTNYSFWKKDFDSMAYKTMLRQILSKWGNLNFEMQQALESDMAIIEEDGSKTYIDNIVDNSNYNNNENSNYNNTEEQNNNMQMESRSIDQNQNLTIEQNYKSAFDALFN